MQTIYLIRHAKALDREEWSGDDQLRPLSPEGRAQAEAIGQRLERVRLALVRSSPALRCVQTVEPLARRTGLPLEVDEALLEGGAIDLDAVLAAQQAAAVRERGGVTQQAIAICAHGDNIPGLLDALGIAWDERCKKGSIWMLERRKSGAIVQARYIKPP